MGRPFTLGKEAVIAKRAPKPKPKPKKVELSDRWLKLVARSNWNEWLELEDGVKLSDALHTCEVWSVMAGDFIFSDCILTSHSHQTDSREGTWAEKVLAKVPNGPTLLLTGDESVHPNLSAHERNARERHKAALERRLENLRNSAGKATLDAARIEAELTELEGS